MAEWPLSVCVLVLVLVCACVPLVLSQPIVMPSLPNQFYTFVTTNFLSQGFTESWEEYVDLTNNRYRYDGRFSDPNVFQVLLGNQLTVWSTMEEVPCTTITLNSTQSWRFRPAFNWYLNMLTATGGTPVYSGISNSSRGISSNTWTASGLYSRTTSSGWTLTTNFTTTYYWSIPYAYYQSPNSVPVRIENVGATYNVTADGWQKLQDTDNVVTFVGFHQVSSFPDSTFTPPPSSQCTNSSSFPSILEFPGPYAVQPPPAIGSQSVPRLPYSFSTQIEGRFQLTPAGGAPSTTVIAGQWTFHMPSCPSSRLEKWEPANEEDTTYSAVYNYTTATGVDGKQYAGILLTDNNGACTASLIPSQWDSALCTTSACFLPELFSDQTFLLDKVTYIGRQEADGVDCDVYQKTGIVFNTVNDNGHSMSYRFNSSLFFYPLGWQIVGIEQSLGNFYSLPVLIQNSGQIVDQTAGTVTAYSDSWSFYLMNDETPDLSVFNPSSACSNNLVIPTKSPDNTQNNNNNNSGSSDDITSGAIAAAVIGAVLGSAIVGAFCYCFKKSFDERKGQAVGNGSRGTRSTGGAGGVVVEEMETIPAGAGDHARLHDEDDANQA